MHPIEHLRHVARSSGAPGGLLATETASALASFVGDDAALLTACQRMVAKQPTVGPIAWIAAHVLAAPEPSKALWQASDELEADRTAHTLVVELPDEASVFTIGWPSFLGELLRRRGDVRVWALEIDGWVERAAGRAEDQGIEVEIVPVEGIGQAVAESTHAVIDFLAAGPEAGLVRQGGLTAAVLARHWGREVWGVAATGVMLPERMYGGVVRRWHDTDRDPLWYRLVEEAPMVVFDRVATPGGVLAAGDARRSTSCPVVPELF